MSHLMGKPTICISENKDQIRSDQLCGNREADQRLCFRYSVSTIPILLKSEISGRFVSELFGNHIVGFPTRWLIYMDQNSFSMSYIVTLGYPC